jgi:hypothetical protein
MFYSTGPRLCCKNKARDKRHLGLGGKIDTQHNIVQRNDTQPNNIQQNDTQTNYSQQNDTQHNITQA